VQAVHFGQKASRCLQFAIDKRLIQNQLGTLVGDLRTSPLLDLPLHGLEVPLDSVHAHGKRVDQVEALAVLGEYRRKHAGDNVSNSMYFDFREADLPGLIDAGLPSVELSDAEISGPIVGSWLLPSPNACRSRRISFPNRLVTTPEVAQKGLYAPVQSTFGLWKPERIRVLKGTELSNDQSHRHLGSRATGKPTTYPCKREISACQPEIFRGDVS
jgi:hypothetical protein